VTSSTYREICEQPEVLARVVDEEWSSVHLAARALRAGGFRFVMLAARGTSDNAALYAKYLFEVRLGMPTTLASPSTFTLYSSAMDFQDVLVIGISQSGESKDILETVRRARERGASTLSITNNENSSLAQAAHIHLWLHAGEEESVAATKTYTAELLSLYLLVAALEGMSEPEPAVRQLPEQTRRILETGWEGVARYRYAEYMTVVSRGYNFATAKEAALKLMETTYIVAEAFSEADLRHGPIAMVTRDFPVVTIVPSGRVRSSMIELVQTLHERGAELVVISDDEEPLQKAAAGFRVPVSCPEELSPITHVLPAQILAHDLSLLRGFDPDSPRGLSKVTESW
jgi:glutamine---fructose-6-phosphate transaminase (isomerizing)